MQARSWHPLSNTCAMTLLLVLGCTGCAQSIQSTEPVSASSAQALTTSSSGSGLAQLSRAEAPTLITVKPPGNPKISHHFISEKKLEALPVRQQPPELAKALADLQTGTIDERKARLKAKAIADMVYVRGGSFMRGDFARLLNIPGVTRMTYNEDDKVLKEITLSDFWIGKYKVTYAEFDVFTDATGRAKTGIEYDAKYRHPNIPAHAHWQNARDYCQWLGRLAGVSMDLPTEAQWEYAARSRGQLFMIPTDDGTIEYGKNVPYGRESRRLSPVEDMDRYPIGLFPPNPLGLYDMSGNGAEWVKDWYAKDAYLTAYSLDPQGPAAGEYKVTRSWWGNDLKMGVAVWRRKEEPTRMEKDAGTNSPSSSPSVYAPALRCVVAASN